MCKGMELFISTVRIESKQMFKVKNDFVHPTDIDTFRFFANDFFLSFLDDPKFECVVGCET